MKLLAVRRARGWTFHCERCSRGPMGRGPMQQHLMGSAHDLTMYEAYQQMERAVRAAEKRRP